MTDTARFSLGVDTGGTFTDAVIYDERTGTVMAKAKAPTSHTELAVGIAAAIDEVLGKASIEPDAIDMVSLSTTLATNALVEGVGRPACLVMIGFDPDSIARDGLRESVGDDDVIVVAGGHDSHGNEVNPLDLDDLGRRVDDVASRVDAFAVTAQFATRNPDHELAARELIRERTGKPVTCSHVLSASLGGPKRGVTALLNARLIPLIDDLVSATATLLDERGLQAPIMVVRGDGSLVGVDFVRERPVETILSGPAASVLGAAHLVGVDEAVVVDVGGTTTDIAVITEGQPRSGSDGANVGGHHTMVEALRARTCGLGGDSEVKLAVDAVGAELVLGPRRVVPLSVLAVERGGCVGDLLRLQLDRDVPHRLDGALIDKGHSATVDGLDRFEQEVLDALEGHVLELGRVATSGVLLRAVDRLAARGLVRLSSFTPTDASHVLGTQSNADAEAARLGAELLARRRDRNGDAIAADGNEVSRLVVAAFIRQSAEQTLAAALESDGLDPDLATSPLVRAGFDRASTLVRVDTGLRVPIVALGAAAATYQPKVAEVLGTSIHVPGNADVASALGAAVGKVKVQAHVGVSAPRRGIYRVHAGGDSDVVRGYDDARRLAEKQAHAKAASDAERAGAGDIQVSVEWREKVVEVEGRPMFVEGTATAVASGRPRRRPSG